jgi:hypothetical protein
MSDNLIKQIKELYMPNVMDDINAVIDQVEALQKKVRDLTEERDEARRMYCETDEIPKRPFGIHPYKKAAIKGWDCFNEERKHRDREEGKHRK